MSLLDLRKNFDNRKESVVGENILNTVNETKRKVSLKEEVKTIFSDVKVEGKKRGYEKAAKEYERILEEIEWAYNETMDIIKKQGLFYRKTSEKLLKIATELNKENQEVNQSVESKTAEVSKKYNTSIDKISSAIGPGTQVFTSLYSDMQTSLIDAVYEFRKMQMDKAEQEGYQEAKEVYEKLIKEKKEKLSELQQKEEGNNKQMVKLILDTVDLFVEEKIKDIDLSMLL